MSNLILNIATVNGTGSLSANQLLTRMLFRSGWAVGSYNFFPSNIAGLACLYNLRLNSQGYTGFMPSADVLVSLNPKSFFDDINDLKCKGLLITDENDRFMQSKVEQVKNKVLLAPEDSQAVSDLQRKDFSCESAQKADRFSEKKLFPQRQPKNIPIEERLLS